MLGELVEPRGMDARVLVPILDLVAAILGAGGEGDLLAENFRTARRGEGIAQAAEAGCQVAGGLRAGGEMLVELLVGGRENDTVLPVDAYEVPIALVPH